MAAAVTHVVAGVLSDADGRVLLAQRPAGKHLAGLWEFPGGKCEPGESPQAALQRELHEELGVAIGAVEKLIGVPWNYAEKSIFLDVYRVLDYTGLAQGREGQGLRWTPLHELTTVPMPPADRPVVAAIRLPRHYIITPEPHDPATFLQELRGLLDAGKRIIQLRAKLLGTDALHALAADAIALVKQADGALLLNDHLQIVMDLGLDGVHLSAAQLLRCSERPLPADRWVGASCHDERELAHAAEIGVDFAVLGPVAPTQSHPEATALGWPQFTRLCAQSPLPVYALGGMQVEDLGRATAAGAQGIAGISAFCWRG